MYFSAKSAYFACVAVPLNSVAANDPELLLKVKLVPLFGAKLPDAAVTNNTLQINATPKSNDLVSLRETYITMGIDNSVITVVEDTISSGSNLSGTGVIPESSY